MLLLLLKPFYGTAVGEHLKPICRASYASTGDGGDPVRTPGAAMTSRAPVARADHRLCSCGRRSTGFVRVNFRNILRALGYSIRQCGYLDGWALVPAWPPWGSECHFWGTSEILDAKSDPGMGSGEKRFDFSTLNDYPPIKFSETRLSILPDWTIIGGVMWPEFTDSPKNNTLLRVAGSVKMCFQQMQRNKSGNVFHTMTQKLQTQHDCTMKM